MSVAVFCYTLLIAVRLMPGEFKKLCFINWSNFKTTLNMKINWGLRIIMLYSGFVVFMGIMVYKCTQQKFDLVTKDYYAQELAYQSVIDGNNNKVALNRPITIDQQDNKIVIEIPESQTGFQNGKVVFYRPSNAEQDRIITMENVLTVIDQNQFTQGLYKVKITWEKNGKQYFDEQSIYIQ
jgi:hypothetical protein